MLKYDLSFVADCGANMALQKDIALIEEVKTSTEELNGLMSKLEDTELSNEGLIGFVESINNVVMRLVNNFKAVISKGGNRSEMKYFYESNTTTIKRLEGKPLEDFEGIMVDFPTGMKGTYQDAVAAISQAYSAMDVIMQVKEGMKAADTILSSMSKGSDTHEDVVALADKVLSNELEKQMKAMKELHKVFTGKKRGNEQKKVSTLFKTMDDLKSCRLTLMASEKKILDGVVIENRLNKMYESVQLTVDFMSNSLESKDPDSYVPSKKFIKSYMDYVGRLGVAVSNYGEIMVAQMATEHNLALVYTKMMEA